VTFTIAASTSASLPSRFRPVDDEPWPQLVRGAVPVAHRWTQRHEWTDLLDAPACARRRAQRHPPVAEDCALVKVWVAACARGNISILTGSTTSDIEGRERTRSTLHQSGHGEEALDRSDHVPAHTTGTGKTAS
jgi:hypothetical protein